MYYDSLPGELFKSNLFAHLTITYIVAVGQCTMCI